MGNRPMVEVLDEAGITDAIRMVFGRSHLRAAAALMPVPNRFTARSWATGHRRLPLPVMERLHRLLQAHAADAWDVHRALGTAIERRRGEPSRRGLGCRAIDPRTGQDKRWRLGGPVRRKIVPAP